MSTLVQDPLLDAERLREIYELDLLSPATDSILQGYAARAAEAVGLPIALVSIVLDQAQYFAAQQGLAGWLAEAGGTPVEWSFCQHVVRDHGMLVVEDARTHPRVQESPLVQQDGVRCYAGLPLVTSRGHVVGTLCVLGHEARSFHDTELERLRALAAEAMARIEGRRRAPERAPPAFPSAPMAISRRPRHSAGAMGRSGTATLPLHHGHVPPWLATRMASLGRVLVEAIVLEYGREEVLRRLAHPFWFQSFGAVMGMDWHSSGITTSVLGALKRGLAPVSAELGIFVCGGRGNASRKTPGELAAVGDRTGLDGDALGRASRLVAKVDSAGVQDGYGLYLHGFFVTADGRWAVVQQGMNGERRDARRYHWLSEGLTSFADEPHAAIEGPPRDDLLLNVVDGRAAPSRSAQLALLRDLAPDRILRELGRAEPPRPRKECLRHPAPEALALPHLALPDHHAVRADDVVQRRLGATLAAAAERGPRDYEDLLLTPGVGPRTVFALATVAEVLHGTPSRFSDPARFSLAHGGKDGHPFPVPLRVYDETLRVLRDAVGRARLGNEDRLSALRTLDQEARRLEARIEGVDFEGFLAHERRMAPAYGGMTVKGPAVAPASPRRAPAPRREPTPAPAPAGQLALPGLALERRPRR